MPAYKTIVFELLKDRPALHERLRAEDTLLQSMEQLAVALRACHLNRMKELAETRPGSDPAQLSSEALELALQELQDSLPPESLPNEEAETFSLDEAMTFLQRNRSSPPSLTGRLSCKDPGLFRSFATEVDDGSHGGLVEAAGVAATAAAV